MEYKVVVVSAATLVSTNFKKAAHQLGELVNEEISNGWEPLGGVAVGRTMSTEEPYLMQAIIKK